MDDLLELRQLARMLRVPASWLKQEANEGRIPCLHAGSTILFNADAVRRVLLERAGQGAREVAHA